MITLLALAAELDIELGLIQETAYRICIASGDDFRADHEAFFVLTSGRIDFTGLEITEKLAGRVRDAWAAASIRARDAIDADTHLVRCPDCGWWADDRTACDVCAEDE